MEKPIWKLMMAPPICTAAISMRTMQPRVRPRTISPANMMAMLKGWAGKAAPGKESLGHTARVSTSSMAAFITLGSVSPKKGMMKSTTLMRNSVR